MAAHDPSWRLVDGRDAASALTRLRVRGRIAGARAIDAAMAGMGLARPVAFVSGFWRSGTTWLQECLAEALGAKTVFEPLSPRHPARGERLKARYPNVDEDAAQALIPDTADEASDIWTALDRAMVGLDSSIFTLSCRWSARESFRRAIVVKDVRTQCNLQRVHARYGVPVVHLRRHPCAVVSSLLRADWHWSFARVRLNALIHEPAVNEPPGADPRCFDDDEISRIAACWAWSERRAAATLEGQPWGRIVTYEDLRRTPAVTFHDLCAGLGLRPTADVAFQRASATIDPAERSARRGAQDHWRGELPPGDIERVERIATAVYPTWRAAWRQ